MSLPDCDEDVFKNGESMGFYDMPKDQAEAMCIRLTKETGFKHDWHYVGGRVHMKRAKTPTPVVDVVAKPSTDCESPWA